MVQFSSTQLLHKSAIMSGSTSSSSTNWVDVGTAVTVRGNQVVIAFIQRGEYTGGTPNRLTWQIIDQGGSSVEGSNIETSDNNARTGAFTSSQVAIAGGVGTQDNSASYAMTQTILFIVPSGTTSIKFQTKNLAGETNANTCAVRCAAIGGG